MFNNKKQFENFLYVEHNYKHTNIISKNIYRLHYNIYIEYIF